MTCFHWNAALAWCNSNFRLIVQAARGVERAAGDIEGSCSVNLMSARCVLLALVALLVLAGRPVGAATVELQFPLLSQILGHPKLSTASTWKRSIKKVSTRKHALPVSRTFNAFKRKPSQQRLQFWGFLRRGLELSGRFGNVGGSGGGTPGGSGGGTPGGSGGGTPGGSGGGTPGGSGGGTPGGSGGGTPGGAERQVARVGIATSGHLSAPRVRNAPEVGRSSRISSSPPPLVRRRSSPSSGRLEESRSRASSDPTAGGGMTTSSSRLEANF